MSHVIVAYIWSMKLWQAHQAQQICTESTTITLTTVCCTKLNEVYCCTDTCSSTECDQLSTATGSASSEINYYGPRLQLHVLDYILQRLHVEDILRACTVHTPLRL